MQPQAPPPVAPPLPARASAPPQLQAQPAFAADSLQPGQPDFESGRILLARNCDEMADSGPVSLPQDPNIGRLIGGRYSIISLVGRGGMGMVYKAEQQNIERLVAIKMLHPHKIADAETIKRFQKEAKAVSRIEHAHTVRVYDFGITDSAQPFIVMDFVDGGSLRDLLQKERTLGLRRTEEIYMQVVDALSCAHEAGIIHRDMKPENIMLCERSGRPDFVYVVDFGISVLDTGVADFGAVQTAGETRGSPAYMSPEQCTKGAEIDHRTDIYSLAVSIYETLSGRWPYQARNAFELLDAHKNATPVPLTAAHPSLAPCESLSAVLLKAMEKNPAKRHQNMQEFGADLVEAFKKDTIRQGYLKNRLDSLSTPAPGEALTLPTKPEVDAQDEEDPQPKRLGDPVESGVRMMKSMLQSITKQHEELVEEEQQSPAERVMFSHCPRCNEKVESGILFCLACGRSLATTHEFAKIRAAQGVFTLPRADSATSYTALPSRRARAMQKSNFKAAQWLVPLLIAGTMFALWCVFGDRSADDVSHGRYQHHP